MFDRPLPRSRTAEPASLGDSLDGVESVLGALALTATAEELSGAEAMALVEQLGRIDRRITGLLAVVVRAIPSDDEFRPTKHHRAATWLGQATGTSKGAAQALLDASAALADQPLIAAAARRGDLSAEQLGIVSDAAAADPTSEADLLAAAATETHYGLRRQAERVKANAVGDDAERHARSRRQRRLCASAGPDGAGTTWRALGPADESVELLAALKMFQPDCYRAAKARGEKPSTDQLLWDCLVAMARFTLDRGPRPTSGGRGTKVIVRVDYSSLVRGHTLPGEECEVTGVGAVPVDAVRALTASGRVFLAAVLTKGKDVLQVVHFGRKPTEFQITALEWLNPRCVVEGCDATFVDWDHNEDWCLTHRTELSNIEAMCPPDHRLKSGHGWKLVEGRGRRPFVPPDHPDHPGGATFHHRRRAASAPHPTSDDLGP